MYVALGTTSEGFKRGRSAGCPEGGCCTSWRPVLDATDENIDTDDCARWWDALLVERGSLPSEGEASVVVSGTGAGFPLIDSRRVEEGCGLAPLGRAIRLFLRSAR